MKYRIISEDELLSLLWDSHKLACLDWDGVDNWEWYMEGRTEYIAQCLKETKQYKDKPIAEIKEIVDEEDLDFQTLAEMDVERYAEYNSSRGLRSKNDFFEDWSGFKESLSGQSAHEFDDGWGGFPETSNYKTNSNSDDWDGLQGGI